MHTVSHFIRQASQLVRASTAARRTIVNKSRKLRQASSHAAWIYWVAFTMTLLTHDAHGQSNPLPSSYNCESVAASFTPLAPQFSDYRTDALEYIEAILLNQNPVFGSLAENARLPAPVRVSNDAFGLNGTGELGSWLALDLRIWEGFYPASQQDCNFNSSAAIMCFPDVLVDENGSPAEERVWAAIRHSFIDATPPAPVTSIAGYNGMIPSWAQLFGPYLSRAYFSEASLIEGIHQFVTPGFGRYGFPRIGSTQHVDIPPTYPPRTLEIAGSTSPLVPAGGQGPRRAQYTEREIVADKLDLITGQPLLDETDLELPFGGAVFRRIRTYSERPDIGIYSDRNYWGTISAQTGIRGWHGMNWMSSEAPLFLIDASMPGAVTVPNGQGPPTCYFSPDAHHTIPFLRQERLNEPPDYVAPTWFDAMLLYDKDSTVWNSVDKRWIVPPSEFKVYLYGRSVIYTIKAYYEDVDPAQHAVPEYQVDSNNQPNGAVEGYGVPYYGLVQTIEDRAGNRVELIYSKPEMHTPFVDTTHGDNGVHIFEPSESDPDGVSALGESPSGASSDCTDLVNDRAGHSLVIRQRGWYKGLIDRIELVAAGENEPSWTLLYSYRHFFARSLVENGPNYWNMQSNAPALHSILVYDHKRSGAATLSQQLLDERQLILPCDDLSDPSEEVSVDGSVLPTFVEVFETDASNPSYVSRQRRGNLPTPFDYQDEVIGPTGGGSPLGALPDWDQLVRFTYADPQTYKVTDTMPANTVVQNGMQEFDWSLKSCGPLDPYDSYSSVATSGQSLVGAWLLKASVFSRLDSGEPSLGRYCLYRYQDVHGPISDIPDDAIYAYVSPFEDIWQYGYGSHVLPRRMTHRYGPATVDRIYANRPEGLKNCTRNRFVNLLIALDEQEGLAGLDCSEPPEPTEPPNPPVSPDDPMFGEGHLGLGDGPGPSGRSSTASNDADDQSGLPLGLMADTIFYRWTEAYQLSTTLTKSSTNATARPASWECFDGRGVAGLASETQSDFAISLWQSYVGGQITTSCGDLNERITQLAQGRSGFLPDGTGLFSSTENGASKWYRMYRFITTPEIPPESGGWRGSIGRSASSVPMQGPEIVWDNEARPGSGGAIDLGLSSASATRALYMYPFRFFIHNWSGDIWGAEPANLPLYEPMWWVAIDEYDSIEDALGVSSSLCYEPSQSVPSSDPVHGLVYSEEHQTQWTNRRVVAFNSAGAVLSDRTWSRDASGAASTGDRPAVLEAYVYDEHLRMEQKFSRGWGAAAAAGQGDEVADGLVEVFEYEPAEDITDPNDPNTVIGMRVPRVVTYHKIRKGCLGSEHQPIREVSAHDDTEGAWWDGLPEFETYYGLGAEDGAGAAAPIGMIEHHYGFWEPIIDDDGNTADPVMKFRIRLGPVFRHRPDGLDVRPVDGQWYSEKGLLIWRVRGAIAQPALGELESGHLVVNRTGSGDDDQIFLTYYQYDEYGRQILVVEDISIAPSSSTGLGFEAGHLAHPEHPAGANAAADDHNQITDRAGVLFVGDDIEGADDVSASEISAILGTIGSTRTSLIGAGVHRVAEAEPLNEVTFTAYNRFGPYKTVHPNGQRDLTMYEVDSEYFRELRAMGVSLEDGEWQFAGQGLYDSDFEGGSFVAGVQGTIDDLLANQWDGSPYAMDGELFTANRLQITAHIEPQYDTAGRLTGVALSDQPESPTPLESIINYDGWGSVLLNITPDGLITRHSYDGMGRLHKTFVGSRDRHFIWGTADETSLDDDLFLTEKLFYGSSPTDAGLPTHKWNFRTKSTEQYGELADWAEPSEGDPSGVFAGGCSGTGCDTTSTGRLERYGYDWRMRRVITRYEDLDETGVVYREERTFLDNMDRVRFMAIYDGPAPGNAPDPTDDVVFGVADPLPDAADFGGASNLLSLDETVYNQAGQVVERRRYNPSNPASGFLVTHSYSDFESRPIWSSSSGGRYTENVYDAKGRLVKTKEMVALEDPSSPGQTVERPIAEHVNIYGTDGNIIEVRTDIFDAAGVSSSPDYFKQEFHWYDSSGRRIATMTLGRSDGTLTRPVEPPLIFDTTGPVKKLVGCSYPTTAEWFEDGKGVARVVGTWYGRSGKPAATLRVTDATRDVSTGVVTASFEIQRTEYNNFGQPVLELEEAYTATNADWTSPIHETAEPFLRGRAMRYEGTRVTEVAAVLPGHILVTKQPAAGSVSWLEAGWDTTPTSPPTLLRTLILYDAPVVQAGEGVETISQGAGGGGGPQPPIPSSLVFYRDNAVSIRPDLIFAVVHPDPETGLPDLEQLHPDALAYYWYYADGKLALRENGNGVVIRYHYDADGNLVRLEGDDSNLPIAGLAGISAWQLPDNAIEYAYDAIGRLESVTTGRDLSGGAFQQRTRSELTYDALGNLTDESQWRRVVHDPSGTVPDPVAGAVAYSWQTLLRSPTDPVSYDNNVNRLSSITYPDRVGTHDSGQWSRRLIELHYGAPGSLDDALSRVSGLTSDGGPDGAEIGHVATYRYDLEGRLAGQDLGGVPGAAGDPFTQTETRSFDRFGRVTARTVESYDAPASTSGPVYQTILDAGFTHDLAGRRTSERLKLLDLVAAGDRDDTHSGRFGYDGLGRLVSEVYGDLDDADPLAALTVWGRDLAYALDPLNRRTGDSADAGWTERLDTNGDGIANSTTEVSHAVDARGRLAGIETGSTTETTTHDAAGAVASLHGRSIYYDWLGRPAYVAATTTGTPVASWSYDGFGRLAWRVAPWSNYASNPRHREEFYFYDGVRRVQEVFHDPVAAIPPWPQTPGGGGSTPEWRTEAEFIWSAASGAPFDTCHVHVDWWDREAWMVQDHQTGTPKSYTDPSGEVAEQYGFDAYGRLVRRDQFTLVKSGSQGYYRSFRQRLGHQGLFVERMDADTTQRVLHPGYEVWAQSRSRWYVPELGRFLSPDPNGTGVPVMSSLAMLGTVPTGPPSGSFEWDAYFGDGLDVFTAYGADPVNATDPTGLFFSLPELSVSNAIQTGFKAYNAYETASAVHGFMSQLQSGISMQQAMLGLAVDMVFDKVGGKLFDKALSGAQRVARAFRNGCNCLTAGAPVLTDQGWKPIEEVRVGDRVLSRDQFEPDGPLVWSEVERVFTAETDTVLSITLDDGRSLELTPEHVIWIDEVGWVEAQQVAVGDTMRLSGATGRSSIASVRYEQKEATTYNIQVAGTRTFFVDGVWVHNDSCDFGSRFANGRSARPAGTLDSAAKREEAKALWEKWTGRKASSSNLDVHHNIPLEWSHKFPFDPNAKDNLLGVDPAIHRQINVEWNNFRQHFVAIGRDPEPHEIVDNVNRIYNQYWHHFVKP